jgi:putative ABC transport system permease protein
MSLADPTLTEPPLSPESSVEPTKEGGRIGAPLKQGGRRWLRPFHKLAGIVQVVLHRMWYHFGLTLLALFGVVLAVGLVTSASFFAQAVDTVMLRREMNEYTTITGRPPFFSRIFSPSSQAVPLSIERVEILGAQLADRFSREIGLPQKWVTWQANSGILELRDLDDEYGDDAEELNIVALGDTLGDISDQITIVEGRSIGEGASGEQLELWIHVKLADKTGLQVGEAYNVSTELNLTVVPAIIAGIWRPNDADDTYWMNNPDQVLVDTLLVRRDDYVSHVEPLLETKVRSAIWQVVLDEEAVIPANAHTYIDGYERAKIVVRSFLPDSQITTPTVSLDEFVDRQTSLTTLLLGFNIPGLGFLLYFLVLTSVIIAYWQRREMMVMLSRGMTRRDVLSFTTVDAVILFILGLPIGLGVGVLLARAMGYASSFLSFSEREPLPVSIYGVSIPLILVTFVVLLIAKLWATSMGNWRSLASQSGEHYRPIRAPFWYRNYLDLILLVPAWYAYQQLVDQGSLALLVQDRPEELYSDPLLVLAPALFIVVLSLVSMRLFRAAMYVLDRLAKWVRSPSLYMAMRQLGRHSHTYINPLLLVVVSLALGVYTLSMAASLDQWLIDRIYYQTGADLL